MGMTWDDIGFALGSNLANGIAERMKGKKLKGLYNDLDAYNNPGDTDLSQARQRVLAQYGLDSLIGQAPQDIIKQSKSAFAAAQQAADQSGMNAAHSLAELARKAGAANGSDLTGHGADDTLDSILNPNKTFTENLFPQEAKAENIGKGLVLGNGVALAQDKGLTDQLFAKYMPQKPEEPKEGLFTGIMNKFETPAQPEQSKQSEEGLFAGLLNKHSPDQPPEQQQGLLEGLLARHRNNRDTAPRNPITLEDLSKATGIDYNRLIQDEARQSAKIRAADSNYVDNVYKMLVQKGYSPDLINEVMPRIEKEARDAQSNELLNQYKTYKGNGNDLAADTVLAKLASIDPAATQVMGIRTPSYKEKWNVGVARDNMKIEQGYNRENAKIKHEYKQQDAADDFTRSVALKNLDFDQQKEFARHAAEVKRYLSNATVEDRIKTMRALGIPEEMINMSVAGVKRGSANNNGQSQAVKNALSYIKLKQEENKNSFDPEWQTKDPNYQKAIQIVAGSLEEQEGNANTGGGAATGTQSGQTKNSEVYRLTDLIGKDDYGQPIKYNPNDYNQAMSMVTSLLEENRKRNNEWPKEAIITRIKQEFGDFAPSIINNIDWIKWGYGSPKDNKFMGSD